MSVTSTPQRRTTLASQTQFKLLSPPNIKED